MIRCHPCCTAKSFDDLIRFNLDIPNSGLDTYFIWSNQLESGKIKENLVKLHSYGLLIDEIAEPELRHSVECTTTFINNPGTVQTAGIKISQVSERAALDKSKIPYAASSALELDIAKNRLGIL